MSMYNGRIAIVGVAESEYGRVPSMTEMELHAQATWRALAESGLHKNDIDAVFCSSHTQGMPTVMLCEYLHIFPRYSDSTSIGGSSFKEDYCYGSVISAGRDCRFSGCGSVSSREERVR